MSRPRAHDPRTGRHRWVLATLVALAVAALGAPASGQAPPAPDDGGGTVDLDALRGEYDELAGEEADLLVRYDVSGARLVELAGEVRAATEAVARADAAVLGAEVDLTARRDEEATADGEAAAARAEVARAEDELRSFAVETYMDAGDAAAMGAVLEVVDGDDGSLARSGYRRTVTDQQRDLIAALVEARAGAARALDRARDAEDEAEEQRRRVEDLRTVASEALAESSRLVEEVATERAGQELLIAEIRTKKVSIEARITSMEKAADGIAALLAAYQGDEEDYVVGAVDVRLPREGGVIGSEFGLRHHPILDVDRLHAGVDIAAPSGSPVLAAADGIVLAAEVRGGYGNAVLLAHGHSLSTVYGHSSSLLVEVGQLVEMGDVIALAGSTGLSTGPHIHFETRIKGVPVNPRSILGPGDASWGKADDDGDGIRNSRDPAPDDPEVPVVDGAGDDDGDGQPNGGDLLREPLQPR